MTADAKQQLEATLRMEQNLKKLQAAAGGLRQGMNAIAGGADPFDILKGSVKNLIGEIPGIGGALQVGVNIAESLFNKVREVQNGILAQGKMASAVGASVEDFSALMFGTGLDAQTLAGHLSKLQVNAETAARGGKEEFEKWKNAGVDPLVFATSGAIDKMRMLADAFSSGKASLADLKQFGGKGFLDLVPVIQKGQAGIDKMIELAKQLDQVTTSAEVAAARQADLAMKQLDATTAHLWKSIATGMSPVMLDASDRINSLITGQDDNALADRVRKAIQAQSAREKLQAEALKMNLQLQEQIKQDAKDAATLKQLSESALDPLGKFVEKLREFQDLAGRGKLSLPQQEFGEKLTRDFLKGVGAVDEMQAALDKMDQLTRLAKMKVLGFEEIRINPNLVERHQIEKPAITQEDFEKSIRKIAGIDKILASPFKNIDDQLALTQQAFEKGAIGVEEYLQVVERLQEQLHKGNVSTTPPATIESGSREDFAFQYRVQHASQESDKASERNSKLQEAANQKLEKLHQQLERIKTRIDAAFGVIGKAG